MFDDDFMDAMTEIKVYIRWFFAILIIMVLAQWASPKMEEILITVIK